ncbi:IucA/IucC family protein [Pseudoduganella namucuonensis]|uniref:Siderophore synthetase component n=1 Tax=Pseudoduganella namucuonensis TaxID=1035707 RepID=A0A1I7JE52_9BURK|nr:IucA/IucC family protein [Pseudoduganella namucuonensis]SFU83433.1 Siderophore synthetase component [Pseudoduganella namucuonensis]
MQTSNHLNRQANTQANPQAIPRAVAALHEARRRASETLLNCYCREVAGPAGHLSVGPLFGQNDWPQSVRLALRASGGSVMHVLLPRTRARLLAVVALPSPTGNYSYRSPLYCKAEAQPWALLDNEELAGALLRELALQTGTDYNDELMRQMRDSVTVTAALLENARPAPFSAYPALAFIESEQSLLYGHPFHPAPKSRQGVSHEDMLRYSPETGARFPLHYFAVRRDCLRQQSLLDQPCDEIVAAQAPAGLAPSQDYALIPVHPWQAGHLLELPSVAAALEDGRLRDLGPRGRDYIPTSSIRTLYEPGNPYFYKCSLNIRITNCVRKNAHYELEGALQVSAIMRELMPELRQRFPGLEVLEEPAFMTVDLGTGKDVSEGFGMILRRNWDGLARPGTTPLLAGALFGNHLPGAERLRESLDRMRGHTGMLHAATAEQWFSQYVELLMYPVLDCYFAHGLVFEPHLQNVLVSVDEGGPRQVFLRDFEGVKLTREHYSEQRLRGVSEAARQALWYSAELGWKRIAYCLFVNNFCEAVGQLAGDDAALQARLWAIVGRHLQRYQRLHGGEASAVRVGELLDGAPLPGKTNLLNRFFKRADRATTYVPVGNPIGAEGAWN